MLRVHHLAIVVRDLDVAERFYSGVLGLPVTQRWQGPDGLPRSVWVKLGEDAFLALERASAETPVRTDQAPGLHCLAFAIPRSEREDYRARLGAAGFASAKLSVAVPSIWTCTSPGSRNSAYLK